MRVGEPLPQLVALSTPIEMSGGLLHGEELPVMRACASEYDRSRRTMDGMGTSSSDTGGDMVGNYKSRVIDLICYYSGKNVRSGGCFASRMI